MQNTSEEKKMRQFFFIFCFDSSLHFKLQLYDQSRATLRPHPVSLTFLNSVVSLHLLHLQEHATVLHFKAPFLCYNI